MFPIDSRDFLSQAFTNNVQECVSNVVETDSPVEGQGYMYSWSLGDPFLKRFVLILNDLDHLAYTFM